MAQRVAAVLFAKSFFRQQSEQVICGEIEHAVSFFQDLVGDAVGEEGLSDPGVPVDEQVLPGLPEMPDELPGLFHSELGVFQGRFSSIVIFYFIRITGKRKECKVFPLQYLIQAVLLAELVGRQLVEAGAFLAVYIPGVPAGRAFVGGFQVVWREAVFS